jgi:hypothetical protein
MFMPHTLRFSWSVKKPAQRAPHRPAHPHPVMLAALIPREVTYLINCSNFLEGYV